ncbi:MAG: hypothetical protein ACRDZ8_10745 [Acidimicrobiales bacterium]
MEHRSATVAGLWLAALCLAAACLAGCSKSSVGQTTTTVAATTTSTTPSATSLTIDGVTPGVLQAPFYPQVTVTKVTCGAAPKGGMFVRIDLPAGGPGTPAHSVLAAPTAVIVVPGAAILINPQYPNRVLYEEAMQSIATGAGDFVLTLANFVGTGADGATVEVGNVQISGGFQCPSAQIPYPGT